MVPDLLVLHAAQLVTARGEGPRAGSEQGRLIVVEDGAVAVRDGRIVAVGTTEDILRAHPPGPDTQLVDAADRVVTPGLVDAHTHLVFAGTRQHEFELRAQGATYAEIMAARGGIHASVRKTREATIETLVQNSLGHLDRMLAHGTTTTEAKSGYGLDLGTEVKQLAALREADRLHPVDVVPTYMGAHAVPQGMDRTAYVESVVTEAIPHVAEARLARFCDVFCEVGVFTPDETERILAAARAHRLVPKIHADELNDTGGAMLAARVGAIPADHLHRANDDGTQAMADARVIATLLPGTAVFLGLDHHAPARRMIALGVPVAVATDFNPGSCFSESLPLMMSFACTQLKLTPAEALVATTINAAYAIGEGHRIGSLEVGKLADLVVWEAEDYPMIPYHMGINLAGAVVKRGRVVHRASPLNSRKEAESHVEAHRMRA